MGRKSEGLQRGLRIVGWHKGLCGSVPTLPLILPSSLSTNLVIKLSKSLNNSEPVGYRLKILIHGFILLGE